MITLRDARIELRVSYRSLEKYMRMLSITPARHPVDMRFYTLDDEQLDRLRQLVAQKRALASTPARAQHGQGYGLPPASAPVVPARSDSPLRASQQRMPPVISLPGDLVTLESFCLAHGVAKQTAMKGRASGRLPVVQGDWKSGRALVRYALDARGRAVFWLLWHALPTFHECEHCPHKTTTRPLSDLSDESGRED
jgi:hypothetical protein